MTNLSQNPTETSGRATGGVRALLFAGLVSLSLLSTGCTTFPGASFGEQMDELEWSVVQIIGYREWGESLNDLAYDLKNLADPEWGELSSTFEMIGW
ncbi:MAG: hypothetical protein AAF517_26485 [Planctomycetota bacterium]